MTIVFLHSFGGWDRSWNLVAPRFSEPTIVLNLRGFGGTPSVKDRYDVNSYMEDVFQVVEPLDEYLLVGHSMGGKFAMALAATRPIGLRGLVLVAPSPPVPEPMGEQARNKLLSGYASRQTAKETVSQIVRRPISEALREEAIQGYLEVTQGAWEGWLNGGSREDISSRMNQVNVPVTILGGSADSALGADAQRRFTAPWLKTSSVLESNGSGHLIPIEDPTIVIHTIEDLFKLTK